MPNALVTGAPEWVPDITMALKSAGFDVVTRADMSANDAPDVEPGPVDCYVLVSEDRQAAPAGRRPPGPLPWWRYAEVDCDLGFADWRESILCLTSLGDA